MKRIIAALTDKVEKLKLDRKVNRVYRSIETAKDNAEDTIDKLNEEASDLLADLATSSEVNGIITKISDKLGAKKKKIKLKACNHCKKWLQAYFFYYCFYNLLKIFK